MIGQRKLLEKIDKIIDSYPKFSIIVGPKGSGKKTIVKQICKKLNLRVITCGIKVDDIREIINIASEQVEPICYLIPDADDMSVGAKNSLLKITEEPPENAYFIMTLESLSNTLETIQSRGTVLTLDTYTLEELIEYRKHMKYKDTYDNVLEKVCETTGEVDELFKCNVDEFYAFAQNIATNIHIPQSGNIFKISSQIKTKNSGTYDGVLLFKAIRSLYIDKAIETNNRLYLLASMTCTECIRDLKLSSLNKVGTVDKWIMDVRSYLKGLQV